MPEKSKKQKKYGTCFLREGRPAIDEKLKDMCKTVSRIRMLRKIKNTMLSTGAYGDVEREAQIRKASQHGDLTEDELAMVNDIFDIQKKLSNKLLEQWSEYNKYKEDNDKEGSDKFDKKFKDYKEKRYREYINNHSSV